MDYATSCNFVKRTTLVWYQYSKNKWGYLLGVAGQNHHGPFNWRPRDGSSRKLFELWCVLATECCTSLSLFVPSRVHRLYCVQDGAFQTSPVALPTVTEAAFVPCQTAVDSTSSTVLHLLANKNEHIADGKDHVIGWSALCRSERNWHPDLPFHHTWWTNLNHLDSLVFKTKWIPYWASWGYVWCSKANIGFQWGICFVYFPGKQQWSASIPWPCAVYHCLKLNCGVRPYIEIDGLITANQSIHCFCTY